MRKATAPVTIAIATGLSLRPVFAEKFLKDDRNEYHFRAIFRIVRAMVVAGAVHFKRDWVFTYGLAVTPRFQSNLSAHTADFRSPGTVL